MVPWQCAFLWIKTTVVLPSISTAAIIQVKTNPTKTGRFSLRWSPCAALAQSNGQRGRAAVSVWIGQSCCGTTRVGWLSGWILSTKGALSKNIKHNHSTIIQFWLVNWKSACLFILQQPHYYEFPLGERFLNRGSQTTDGPGYWSAEWDKTQNSEIVMFIGRWLHLMTYKEAWWLMVIHRFKIRNRGSGSTVQSNVLDVSLQQNKCRLPQEKDWHGVFKT